MPKTVYLPPDDGSIRRSSGVDITWTKTSGRLSIGGWFDTYVGIENTSMTLREFFDMLGITEKDCKRAFNSQAR